MFTGLEDRMVTGEEFFILNYKGVNFEVVLLRPRGETSLSYKERPFKKTWDLVSLTPSSIDGVSEEELKTIIKEALDVYGENCMSSSIDRKDMNIIFKF